LISFDRRGVPAGRFGSTVTLDQAGVTVRYMRGYSFRKSWSILAKRLSRKPNRPDCHKRRRYRSDSKSFVFQHSFRPKARPPRVHHISLRAGLRADTIFRLRPSSRRCQMTSIADRISGPPLAAEADAICAGTPTIAPAAPLPVILLPVGAERELRLDLFRGLALWLIFIDHLPPNLLTWFTIRNYGFSDATEIFIFHLRIYRGVRFTDARCWRSRPSLVATARILAGGSGRFMSRHVFSVHDLPRRNFLCRHPFREPAVYGRNGNHGFSQAAGRPPSSRRLPPEISPGQHGRATPLHRG